MSWSMSVPATKREEFANVLLRTEPSPDDRTTNPVQRSQVEAAKQAANVLLASIAGIGNDGARKQATHISASISGHANAADGAGDSISVSLNATSPAPTKAEKDEQAAKDKATEAAAASTSTRGTPTTAATTPTATPATGDAKTGKLPEDFPGHGALEAAGITTYAKVRAIAERDELTNVEGVGDATAAKIKEALA